MIPHTYIATAARLLLVLIKTSRIPFESICSSLFFSIRFVKLPVLYLLLSESDRSLSIIAYLAAGNAQQQQQYTITFRTKQAMQLFLPCRREVCTAPVTSEMQRFHRVRIVCLSLIVVTVFYLILFLCRNPSSMKSPMQLKIHLIA